MAQALLPFPQYLSTPGLASQVGNSSYHALQINLQKRFGSGLSFLAAYTASKNLTNAFQAINGAGGVIIQHPSLPNTGKAIDAADRSQQLALSWTYDLPFGKGKAFGGQAKGVINANHWRVEGFWHAKLFYGEAYPRYLQGHDSVCECDLAKQGA